jgi:hypothetical protein
VLIVGNPPWDKTRFEEPLFFSQYHSNYRTSPISRKSEIAASLLARPNIRAKYEREKERIDLINQYLSLKFPLSQGVGDNNLFRFFVEKSLSLLAPGGGLSYVLPTAILTEDSSIGLRKRILEKYYLRSFDSFENRRRLFPGVNSRYKFCLAQIENRVEPQPTTQARFMLSDPQVLNTEAGLFPYSLADVQTTSPRHWAYMETANGEKDLKTLKKLYSLYPPFAPTWLEFRRELHACKDQKIFLEKDAPGRLPIYKGEMIWQFQARVAQPKYWLEPSELDAYFALAQLCRLKNDLKAQFASDWALQKAFKPGFDWPKILSFLGLKNEADLLPLIIPERNFPRLAFRAISGNTDERTLVAALLPRDIAAQNSLWLSIPGQYALDWEKRRIVYKKTPLPRLLFAQALFNSLTVDWILRAMVAINVSKTYVRRLPLPQPTDQELATNPLFLDIIQASARLSLAHEPELWNDLKELKELKKLKETLNFDQAAPLLAPEDFDAEKAALDLKITRLYGLTPDEMENILHNFKVIKKKYPNYYSTILYNIKHSL